MARPVLRKPEKGAVPGLFIDDKDRYWVSVRLTFAPGAKRRPILRVVGSRSQALKYLTKIREQARQGRLFPEERVAAEQSGLTIADLCARFRREDELINKDSDGHASMEAEWIRILGDMLWHEITIDQIAAQQSIWLAEGKSPGRINRYTTRLHKVLATAARRRIIRHNPIAGYVRLQEPRGRRRKLEANEELRLRQEFTDSEWAYIEFAILSGFRQEEQFGCRSDYVDLVANTISLPETKTVARRHEGRTIPMSGRLKAVVLRQMQLNSPWIFPNHHRTGPMNADNFMKRVFRPACRRAGVKDLRWHDLRRRCASDLHLLGWPVAAVMKYLGHKNSATTDRYISVVDSELATLIKLQDRL